MTSTRPARSSSPLARRMAAALLLGLTPLLASCNIVGPVGYLVSGPPKQPALFTLDAKRPTIVFIDDKANILPRSSLRATIAERTEFELLQGRHLETVLDSRAIHALASRDTSERGTPIVTLAKRVKAQIVIHVSIDRFALTTDGVSFQPTAQGRVKVIDVDRPEVRIWPDDAKGHPLSITLPYRQSDVPTTATGQLKAQDDLATQFGSALARLFYEHDPASSPSQQRPAR